MEVDGSDGFRPAEMRVVVGLVLAGLAHGLLATSSGCRMAARREPPRRPQSCAECHAEITRQWLASAHASAWTSEAFHRDSEGRTAAECLPCHAPDPLLEQSPSDPPTLRDAHRDDGVDCRACHAVCCDYAGPYSTWGPHGVQVDRTRLPCSTFCGRCHVVEMEEYKSLYVPSVQAPERPKQCADCHMPAYCDRLTQGHLLSLAHPRRVVHDHSFPLWTEAVTRGAVEASDFRVSRPSESRVTLAVTLINRGAGHRIPSSEFGHREVRVLAQVLDGEGRVLGEDEWPLYARYPDALSPGKPADFLLEASLPEGAAPQRVRLLVERVNLDRSFRHELFCIERPCPD